MDPDPGSLSFIAFTLAGFLGTFGPQLLVVLLLLMLSGLISGSEVAFFSLSHSEIEDLKHREDRVSKVVVDLVTYPKRLLATILIFNNLVNVAIILISTVILHKSAIKYGWGETTFSQILLTVTEVGLITFILLFFGEITPKIYASQKRVSIVRLLAIPLRILRLIFSPLSWLLIHSTRFIDKRIKVESEAASFEDIKQAIELTSEEESPEEEKEILKGIVNFSSISVKAILRARVDVRAIELETTFKEVVELVNEFGYSRIPVYEETLDQIKGILYVKDLLPLLKSDNAVENWQSLVRPAYFIPETKKIDDLLDEFKSRRLHIAIVVDEFGGTSGLVTLEDIIEEIFGEIVDEFDNEELAFSKLSENTFVFDGKMALNDIIKVMELPDSIFDEAKGEADSLAGLILEIQGRIPDKGETIEFENFEFHIESVSKKRIQRVKVVVHREATENTTAKLS